MGRIVYIVAAILILSCFIAWFRGNALPHLVVPTPVAPAGPNAFDDLANAVSLEEDSKDIDNSLGDPHAVDADNDDGLHGLSPAAIQQYVAENKPVIAAIHEGFSHAYFAAPIRSPSQLLPYLARDRSLARLLSFDARASASSGDWSGSMGYSIDAMQIGAQVEQHGGLIHKLVGIACRAIGRRTAWFAVDHLSGADSEIAARRIEHIEAMKEPFSTTIQEEEYSGEATLQEILSNPDPVGYVQSMSGSTPAAGTAVLGGLVFMVYPKQTISAHYVSYMNESVRRAGMPWPVESKLPAQTTPRDPVNAVMLPVFTGAGFKVALDDTMDRLLMTSAALRAYDLDHGSYPSSMDQLVPKYLSAVPQDPFAAPALFKYRLLGPSKYLLYSIGPDGVDDGGKPFAHNLSRSPGSKVTRLWLEDTDKGDIVAGVNRG